MPVCLQHGIYHPNGTVCFKCGVAQYNEAKSRNREEKKYVKELEKKKPSKIKKLQISAQSILSSWFKKGLKGKYFNCVICQKPVLIKGSHLMNTLHCSHYFPKGIYWQLMFLPENISGTCYNCNVNNPGTAPAMRNHLVSRHGEDKIKELEKKAEEFLIKVKTGQLKSRPDELFLMANIKQLKTK